MKIHQILALVFLFNQSTYPQDPSKTPSLKQMLTQPERKESDVQQLHVSDQKILKQASQVVQKSDEKVQSTHNTYRGTPITPQTLKKMAPKMSPELKQAVKLWVAANQQFLKTVLASPTPFDHETRKEKYCPLCKSSKKFARAIAQ